MIDISAYQQAYEPIAIKNFQVGFKEIPNERDILFSVKTSKKLKETYVELGDSGVMPELVGDLEYEDTEQGYSMTVEAKEYAKGMQIKKKFVLTDQLDIVEGLPKLIGLSARRRIASDVCAFLNDAFNTSLTTIDGLALCSTAHTSNNGGSNQSNLGTVAFSEPQVDAVRILMKGYLSNTDELYETSPDLLIVPRSLEKAAYELISSSGKVDTANNNANFHKGKYKVLVLDRLDDDNNWFFADSELLKIMNVWNNVCPLEFGQAENFDGVALRYRGYTLYGYGTRDWRPIHGSNVA